MIYQIEYRLAVLSFIENGGSKVEASRLFKVSRETIYRWLSLDDLKPKPASPFRRRKIDKSALCHHVARHPDMFVHERAVHFGVHQSSMSRALARFGLIKKKRSAMSNGTR